MATYDRSVSDNDDLQYVYPLPKGLDTNCPVCFSALYTDPYVNVTCGHHICGACSARIQECPNCRSELDLVPDLSIQRTLKSLVVYCSKREQGCQWEGELGELEHHHRDEEKGCLYIKTRCPHNGCEVEGLRHEILTHKEIECPFRPVTCEHCNFWSTWNVMSTGVHYERCSLYPLTCAACGMATVRKDMEEHQEEVCPKTIVGCDISNYGCEWEGPREEIERHMKEKWSHHFYLGMQKSVNIVTEHFQEKMRDYEARFEEMEAVIDQQKKEIRSLRQKIDDLEDATNDHIQYRVSKLKEEIEEELTDRIEQSFAQWKENNHTLEQTSRSEQASRSEYSRSTEYMYEEESSDEESLNLSANNEHSIQTFTYSLKTFSRWKDKGEVCYSQPFYTSSHGYRMRLRVHPNGYGKGEGTHLSIYVCLLEGNSDKLLKWPFMGKVIVQLQNGTLKYKKTIYYDHNTPDAFGMICKKDHYGKWTSQGNGFPQFLHHNELAQYLKNDRLEFTINVIVD